MTHQHILKSAEQKSWDGPLHEDTWTELRASIPQLPGGMGRADSETFRLEKLLQTSEPTAPASSPLFVKWLLMSKIWSCVTCQIKTHRLPLYLNQSRQQGGANSQVWTLGWHYWGYLQEVTQPRTIHCRVLSMIYLSLSFMIKTDAVTFQQIGLPLNNWHIICFMDIYGFISFCM